MTKMDDAHFKMALKLAIQHMIDEDIAQTESDLNGEGIELDEKTSKRIWNRAKRKANAKKPWVKILKRVAMIAVAILSTMVFIVGTYSMHVGAGVENIKIIESSEFFTLQFITREGDNIPTVIEEEMRPTYIPHEWPISVKYPKFYGVLIEMRNSDKELIYYSQRSKSAIIRVPSDCKMKTVNIGRSAGKMFFDDDGSIILIWFDKYVFELYGKGVDAETLIKMARSVES